MEQVLFLVNYSCWLNTLIRMSQWHICISRHTHVKPGQLSLSIVCLGRLQVLMFSNSTNSSSIHQGNSVDDKLRLILFLKWTLFPCLCQKHKPILFDICSWTIQVCCL